MWLQNADPHKPMPSDRRGWRVAPAPTAAACSPACPTVHVSWAALTPVPALFELAEAVCLLDGRARAAEMHELILPFHDRHISAMRGTVSWGSAQSMLGGLATTAGYLDRAAGDHARETDLAREAIALAQALDIPPTAIPRAVRQLADDTALQRS
jgi:hypothetical protein